MADTTNSNSSNNVLTSEDNYLSQMASDIAQIKLLLNNQIYEQNKKGSYVLSGVQKFTTSSGAGTLNITLNADYYTDLNIYALYTSTPTNDSQIVVSTVTDENQSPMVGFVNATIPRFIIKGVRVNTISCINPDAGTKDCTYYVSYIQYKQKAEPILFF